MHAKQGGTKTVQPSTRVQPRTNPRTDLCQNARTHSVTAYSMPPARSNSPAALRSHNERDRSNSPAGSFRSGGFHSYSPAPLEAQQEVDQRLRHLGVLDMAGDPAHDPALTAIVVICRSFILRLMLLITISFHLTTSTTTTTPSTGMCQAM